MGIVARLEKLDVLILWVIDIERNGHIRRQVEVRVDGAGYDSLT